jgi:hypothetical protein
MTLEEWYDMEPEPISTAVEWEVFSDDELDTDILDDDIDIDLQFVPDDWE